MNFNTIRILLVDDRLGYMGTAKFFQWQLNQILAKEESTYTIKIFPECFISNLDNRLKTEPFDLILLDLDFIHNSPEALTKRGDPETNELVVCNQCNKKCEEGYDDIDEKLKGLGLCALKKVIRPNFPGLPVIVFTAKEDEQPQLAASRAVEAGNARHFRKSSLTKNEKFLELLNIVVDLVEEFRFRGFRDRIETKSNRLEEVLLARSRDYMHTRLWQVLTGKIQKRIRKGKNEATPLPVGGEDRFALTFFDMDGMKQLDENYGYLETNKIIKAFADEIITKVLGDIPGIVKIDNDKYDTFVGRYFRERGDEFCICWTEKLSTKRKAINKVLKLIHHIQDEDTQKEFSRVLEPSLDKPFLELTASFGLFVFPDDLVWSDWEYYNELTLKPENCNLEELKRFSERVYKQMMECSIQLKDNAKRLGKNQACYYNWDGNIALQRVLPKDIDHDINKNNGGDHLEENNGHVNILLNHIDIFFVADETPYENILTKLLQFVLGKSAFDIIKIDPSNENELRKVVTNGNYGRSVQLIMELNEIVLRIQGIDKEGNKRGDTLEVDIGEFIYCFFDSSSNPVQADNRRRYYQSLMESSGFDERKEALRTHTFMRDIFIAVMDVLRKLSRHVYKLERYWPRPTIQRELQLNLLNLKDDIIVLNRQPSPCDMGKQLWKFYSCVKVPHVDRVWVSERPSNKAVTGGLPSYKHSLMFTLEIHDSEAYEFFIMESGRNTIKFQHFVEGYFKGFLQTNPDRKFSKEMIDLIYWEDMIRREKEKRKRILVCRHGLFSPVDPIVYNELVEVNRVRIDIDPKWQTQQTFIQDPNKEVPKDARNEICEKSPDIVYSDKKMNTIYHIPLHEVLSSTTDEGIIAQGSIVPKFVERYFGAAEEGTPGGDIRLVVYTGTEMIGPSVQLAEMAGELTRQLSERAVSESRSFVLFDIFSGSSATSLSSLKSLEERPDQLENICIYRLDSNKPDMDYLKIWRDKKALAPLKEKLNNLEENYIEGHFDTDRGTINGENPAIFIKKLINPQTNIPIQENEKIIDLVIADPPHILAIPFLFRGQKDCFANAVKNSAHCFIVYYAHKEQIRLCEYISRGLKNYFDIVWRVMIAGEEMAICGSKELKEDIEKAIESTRNLMRRYYYSDDVLRTHKIE